MIASLCVLSVTVSVLSGGFRNAGDNIKTWCSAMMAVANDCCSSSLSHDHTAHKWPCTDETPAVTGQVFKAVRGGVQDVACKQIAVRCERQMDKFMEVRACPAFRRHCTQ